MKKNLGKDHTISGNAHDVVVAIGRFVLTPMSVVLWTFVLLYQYSNLYPSNEAYEFVGAQLWTLSFLMFFCACVYKMKNLCGFCFSIGLVAIASMCRFTPEPHFSKDVSYLTSILISCCLLGLLGLLLLAYWGNSDVPHNDTD